MRLMLLVLTAGFLTGCEGMNDTLVRRSLLDHRLGSRVNEQISEGLRRRMALPPPPQAVRSTPPSYLDQG